MINNNKDLVLSCPQWPWRGRLSSVLRWFSSGLLLRQVWFENEICCIHIQDYWHLWSISAKNIYINNKYPVFVFKPEIIFWGVSFWIPDQKCSTLGTGSRLSELWSGGSIHKSLLTCFPHKDGKWRKMRCSAQVFLCGFIELSCSPDGNVAETWQPYLRASYLAPLKLSLKVKSLLLCTLVRSTHRVSAWSILASFPIRIFIMQNIHNVVK